MLTTSMSGGRRGVVISKKEKATHAVDGKNGDRLTVSHAQIAAQRLREGG